VTTQPFQPHSPIAPPPQESVKKSIENSTLSKNNSLPVEKTTLSSAQSKTLQPSPLDLEQELTRLFSTQRTEYKVERVKQAAHTTEKVTTKLQRRRRAFAAGVAMMGVATGIIFLAGTFGLSSFWLQRQLLSYVMTTSSSQVFAAPPPALRRLARVVSAQSTGYRQVLDLEVFTEPAQAASLTQQLLAFDSNFNQSRALTSKLVSQMLGATPGDVTQTSQNAFTHTQLAFDTLTQIQVSLQEYQPSGLAPAQEATWQQFGTKVSGLRKTLITGQQLQPLFSTLFGVQQKRTYAILLQNNQELRPGGGFIQAIALVTFDKGMIIDTQVLNVYDLDARLSATVTPSEDMQKLLGEQRMYLRDSNWDPDFPTAANLIATLIEKSFGRKIDGVIGLNLLTVEELLKELGPLELPEFNEVITERNMWERMEFHSEIQLVPDANTPDYSTVFFKRLFQKMTTVQEQKSLALLRVWYEGLQSHQVVWSLINPNENVSLQSLGWTGALLTPQCPPQFSDAPCQIDTIAQVEANIGVNKANYHVQRDIRHTATILSNAVRHTRTVTFKNTSQSNAWPQGTYKSYLRFYVPANAVVESVAINGTPVESSQLIQDIKHDKVMVGVVSETPIQTQTTLVFTYSVPASPSSLWSYAFFNQHQPGVTENLREFKIEYDPKLRPALIAPQAQVAGTSLLFAPEQNTHFFGGVQFKR
jgi:hypothetical protein